MENFTINLFGIDYSVEYVNETLDMKGMNGRIYYDEQIIRVKRDLMRDTKKNTLLHEIIHSVLNSSGLESVLDKNNIDVEFFTETLTNSLFNVIKSNKELMKKLF
ncbi:MAG: hypothetical protein B6I31_00030 [Desulfobacteraceae bacterium 4572_19]|nr:MAG: hypothetical protein B6I31_00030 [Desulfobacteraceae bacterium 4572_19]